MKPTTDVTTNNDTIKSSKEPKVEPIKELPIKTMILKRNISSYIAKHWHELLDGNIDETVTLKGDLKDYTIRFKSDVFTIENIALSLANFAVDHPLKTPYKNTFKGLDQKTITFKIANVEKVRKSTVNKEVISTFDSLAIVYGTNFKMLYKTIDSLKYHETKAYLHEPMLALLQEKYSKEYNALLKENAAEAKNTK